MDIRLSLLAVDDEVFVLESIRDYFANDYCVRTFADARDALEACQRGVFDILMADHRMPHLSGLDLLLEAKKRNAYTCGILLTAYADKDLLIRAVNQNLVQFVLEKPVDLESLSATLKQAQRYIQQQRSRPEKGRGEEPLFGLDGDLADVARIMALAAPTGESILITGETGTGKELIARRIHRHSPRADGPFVKINCAAIPDHLLESELFGYARGAFTGADAAKAGRIETADKGTLFLDEIAEMKPALQSKLLTVLQDKRLERLGSNVARSVDFRLITATNQDIGSLVDKRLFRDDLYYRINTVHLHLPPLRERTQDILALSRILLTEFSVEFDRPGIHLSAEGERIIREYHWPGNVRELENALKRAVILLPPGKLALDRESLGFLLSSERCRGVGPEDTIASLTDLVEKRVIPFSSIEELVLEQLLARYGGDIPRIVDTTAIARDRLYRLKRRWARRAPSSG